MFLPRCNIFTSQKEGAVEPAIPQTDHKKGHSCEEYLSQEI
jgi:hypothetical protein